ncbi:hypothetical protein P7K49_005705 [Saguinus oedipus]|uniref:Uncharacterized protein n=1 Tax=Saguinus oedipus TaxID=9490 RepID=A0ABQ9W0B3_SAGOE|nr:hypothetical protein P7K49_005705 [Saguinus oedipus]
MGVEAAAPHPGSVSARGRASERRVLGTRRALISSVPALESLWPLYPEGSAAALELWADWNLDRHFRPCTAFPVALPGGHCPPQLGPELGVGDTTASAPGSWGQQPRRRPLEGRSWCADHCKCPARLPDPAAASLVQRAPESQEGSVPVPSQAKA